jgi:hypothetical protein
MKFNNSFEKNQNKIKVLKIIEKGLKQIVC